MNTGRVVVVGSLNADLILTVDAVPGPGETVLGGGPTYGCGGKGANQAMAAARVGATVAMVGCVGDDAGGDRWLAELTDAEVDVTGLRRMAGPTGLAVVAVAEDGENAIIVAPGANAACSPTVVADGLRGLIAADVVVAQGEIPVPAIVAAVDQAHQIGARLVLNLAPPVAVDLAPGGLHALVVNQHEAAVLLGDLADDPQRHAVELARRLDTTVVITLGGAGVLWAGVDGVSRVDAYPPDRVVDTTGAGDAFVGAFAAALAAGRPISEAVRWGAAAGSIVVATVGAQSPELSAARIEQLVTGQPRV